MLRSVEYVLDSLRWNWDKVFVLWIRNIQSLAKMFIKNLPNKSQVNIINSINTLIRIIILLINISHNNRFIK